MPSKCPELNIRADTEMVLTKKTNAANIEIIDSFFIIALTILGL
jgi:hypothetical protein